jgi:ESCO1/2 acetyl-transferase
MTYYCSVLHSFTWCHPFCCFQILPTERSRYSKKLELLHSIVDQELGFVSNSPTGKPFTTYLCIVNKRVVGMVLVEEIAAAYRLLVPMSSSSPGLKFGLTRSAEPTKAGLGIYQLWVHRHHRHRGIASVIVDVARKQMVFGCTPVPVHQVAFSSPTESGLAFAQYYYSVRGNPPPHPPHPSLGDNSAAKHDVLVYDCG